MGILDRLFASRQIEAQTRQYAEALADGACGAIGAIKLAVRGGRDRALDAALRHELELVGALYGSPDAREGIRAFIEKRPPRFS